MTVIDLNQHREGAADRIWSDYCAALKRAQQTMSIEDGRAAGDAWKRWLDLFLTPEQRSALAAAKLPSERTR